MRNVTLLWALRSPCNLGCTYCYFGTIEDHRLAPPQTPGQLSHLSRADLSLPEIDAFLATVGESAVRRVFLAGGEPLIWPHTLHVVRALKAADVEVVLCTNGIPLNRPEITEQIVDLGVEAVSVSLDSADPAENDLYRPARNGVHGWAEVISGIRQLVTARAKRSRPRIGLYAAVTRRNLPALRDVAALAADLGLDYFVPQPISLAPDHPLRTELSLRPSDRADLVAVLGSLYDRPTVNVPHPSYVRQFVETAMSPRPLDALACFGGSRLHFVEPDGSLWDCPSALKIAATAPDRRRSIRGAHAAELFPPNHMACGSDCALMSVDCVSMWPLMEFDRFLAPRGQTVGTAGQVTP